MQTSRPGILGQKRRLHYFITTCMHGRMRQATSYAKFCRNTRCPALRLHHQVRPHIHVCAAPGEQLLLFQPSAAACMPTTSHRSHSCYMHSSQDEVLFNATAPRRALWITPTRSWLQRLLPPPPATSRRCRRRPSARPHQRRAGPGRRIPRSTDHLGLSSCWGAEPLACRPR